MLINVVGANPFVWTARVLLLTDPAGTVSFWLMIFVTARTLLTDLVGAMPFGGVVFVRALLTDPVGVIPFGRALPNMSQPSHLLQ